MSPFAWGRSRPGRLALAVCYVALLSLAVIALLDLGELLQPASVPAFGQPGGALPDPGLLGRWLQALGLPGLRAILDAAIPGLRGVPSVRGDTALFLGSAPRTGFWGILFDALTSVNLSRPETILAAQITGMRSISLPSRGSPEIRADLPGEGETTPELPAPAGGSGAFAGGNGAGDVVPAGFAAPAAAGQGPLVAVYQTHASESYLPLVKHVTAGATGSMDAEEAFADDPEITVVRVGQELASVLAGTYGISTVHSRRIHDADGRLGAYVESARTVEGLLQQYPSLKVLLDIHRDSPRRDLTTATVGGKPVARILLVVGTNSKLAHPNWQRNYQFACALNEAMGQMYPGLSRGILVTESRYNQHYLPHSVLVEVGGVDNTLEETLNAVRFFAGALAAVIRLDPGLVPASPSGTAP